MQRGPPTVVSDEDFEEFMRRWERIKELTRPKPQEEDDEDSDV